jgi:hypothetical protein
MIFRRLARNFEEFIAFWKNLNPAPLICPSGSQKKPQQLQLLHFTRPQDRKFYLKLCIRGEKSYFPPLRQQQMFQNLLFFISEPPAKLLSAQRASSRRLPPHRIVLSLRVYTNTPTTQPRTFKGGSPGEFRFSPHECASDITLTIIFAYLPFNKLNPSPTWKINCGMKSYGGSLFCMGVKLGR